METKPLSGQLATLLPTAATASFKNPDDETELTESEIEDALRNARRKKAAFLREQEYIKKISQPRMYPVFTTEQIRQFMLKKAAEKIHGFKLDGQNSEIFNLLCLYVAQDPRFESSAGLSLKKGIMLLGPVGCGKTSLMKLFSKNSNNDFAVYSSRKIAEAYTAKDGGINTINLYSNLFNCFPEDHNGQNQIGLCLDDLGTETLKKHFGNEQNVVEEILQNRYDNGLIGKTHLTTNLSADQIEEVYGRRVRSRLREMCNMLVFDAKAEDRRS